MDKGAPVLDVIAERLPATLKLETLSVILVYACAIPIGIYAAVRRNTLGERVTFYDPAVEPLSLFERFQVTEQLKKGLDRKVWLPSGGSLIIEHTEALTVIDVNTGRNVGASNLEDTVFQNNLEAAVEIARQLRLRDIGGIIGLVEMTRKRIGEGLLEAFADRCEVCAGRGVIMSSSIIDPD